MIANIIKDATCRVSCGDVFGTGHLITECNVLTARHCVTQAINSGTEIELTFFGPDGNISLLATIIAHSEELDACILSIPQPLGRPPISLNDEMPREGSAWQSFGYPSSKTIIGHRVVGTISHLLDTPKLKMDMDLTVDQSYALQSYEGLSGAAVVSENANKGMIRLKVDRTLGAISIQQLWGFLAENGIKIPQPDAGEAYSTGQPHISLADRNEFQEEFEKLILKNPGNFIFLEGAHGLGKTTFCNEFKSENRPLLTLGTYCLLLIGRGPGVMYRAQPEVFFDWLSTAISTLITGRNSRKEELGYPAMVRETSVLLNAFSDYCVSTQRRGIFFLDGLNEAQSADPNALVKLVNLLPLSLPKDVTIVFSAPNFQNVSALLSGRVKSQNIISLPPLSDEASSSCCWHALAEDKATPTLVARICEKAQGHPLYLRFLIEYANSLAEGNTLDEFPTLTGSIEQYYETLWQRLLEDSDAINLLAIIARLRWGIGTRDLLKILTPSEQSVFIPTISRIRHLLLNPDYTTIYHPSFTEFLISKTVSLEMVVQKRLAEFCVRESGLEYCSLNVIFHLLRSDDEDRSRGFVACNQIWVDNCVELGVEPDTLLFDIETTISAAVNMGSSVEVVRLILLSQRVSFRYDTLFAQSARLIAEALIALNRPKEALKHLIRFNTLIAGPNEVLQVAFRLIQNHYSDEALELLRLLQQKFLEAYKHNLEFRDFIRLSCLHLRTFMFLGLIDGRGRLRQIEAILKHSARAIEDCLSEEPPEVWDECFAQVKCVPISHCLCFRDSYTALAELKKNFPGREVPPDSLGCLIQGLFETNELLETFCLPKAIASLGKVFLDIEELVMAGGKFPARLVPAIVNDLIQLGASPSVINLIAGKGKKLAPHPLIFKAANGVDVDFPSFHQGATEWRIEAFLHSDFDCPLVGPFDENEWHSSLDQFTRVLFWCEGVARRAKTDGNESLWLKSLAIFNTRVLHSLNFTLAERVKWKDSYAIPESVFPFLYDRITSVIIDCYPKELASFLQDLSKRVDDQCGLYSEGFREIMFSVLKNLTIREIEPSLLGKVIELLQKLKEHVVLGVENRHELVPDLLKLIPLFVKLGASEEGHDLYSHMLSVSMGPTWYKEDQLGLMVSVLRKMPPTDKVGRLLPVVAGYLERASGEMTFQRFVRYEKQAFIGELFRRGRFASGCSYFTRQTCGTLAELRADAQYGFVDKPNPMVGMRFPGGALDEQPAILEMVRNGGEIDWRLLWALLEIYQVGDERHLEDFAKEYAKIANAPGRDPTAISEMVNRLHFVINAEIEPNLRRKFLNSFVKELAPELSEVFSRISSGVPNAVSQEGDPLNVGSSKVSSTSPVSDVRNEDERFFLPGVFGKQSAMKEAEAELANAEAQLKLGNLKATRLKAANVLSILQAGGWSIWGNLSSTSDRAESLLREGVESAGEVVRLYGPLLKGERHQAKWMLAEHLINKVADIFSENDKTQLLQNVIDHVQIMVGDAENEIAMFGFLSDETQTESPRELFRFVLWLLEHPKKLRREKAAGMVAWLVEKEPLFFEEAVKVAFSMATGFSADILCGVFDEMSARQAINLWERVFALLDLDGVLQTCKHVGRLTVLHRIAGRAGTAGSKTGAEVSSRVEEQFRPGAIELGIADRGYDLPNWADCISREWDVLNHLGVQCEELFIRFEEELTKLCQPLDIMGAWNLEKAVSNSFREAPKIRFNRWEAKVRFGLSTAIFPYASKRNFREIELALRIYNPSMPERTLQPSFASPAEAIINSISIGKDFAGAIGFSDFFFLNYHEVTGRDENEKFIEILAVIVPSSDLRRKWVLPSANTSFRSRELPNLRMVTTSHETCWRLEPDFAFFGSFTPAFPLQTFKELIEAKESDFYRVNWRNGRTSDSRNFGRPLQEGCLLAVKREAIRLPAGKKLAWILRLSGRNGEKVTMVDSQNNQLI
jgi:hypothetical protein